jgi:hypothetical protein
MRALSAAERIGMRAVVPLIVVLSLVAGAWGQARPSKGSIPQGMKTVEGRYHHLIYDLTDAEAAEVLLRMEAMVDEYISRTRDFSGRLNTKLPFMIFRNASDYRAAGGMAGSAGMFDGHKLMAIAGDKLDANTWHVIQHEGFHQFASAVIGGDMPVWVNEGLAEYFGEAVYTGDGFVSGVIPDYRRQRIQEMIQSKTFRSVPDMMRMSLDQWNSNLQITNYDQAFAMVTFLAHGEGGKYQKAFGQFIALLNKRTPWDRAWLQTFGSAEGFQERLTDYWSKLPTNPSLEGYTTAVDQMLASYLARGTAQKQTFADVSALVAAIDKNEVKFTRGNELPPSLAATCKELFDGLEKQGITFELVTQPKGPPMVVAQLKDGAKITATFKLRGNRVAEVRSKIENEKAATTKPSGKSAKAKF